MKQMTNEKHQHHRRNLQSSSRVSSFNLKKNRLFTKLNRFDVLLGRGSEANEHQGNRSFRNQVNKLKDEYHLAKSREQKKTIILCAIRCVTDMGGRFVRKVDYGDKQTNVYESIDMKAVFNKTRQAIHYCSRQGKETVDENVLLSDTYCSMKAPPRPSLFHPEVIASTTGRYGQMSPLSWDALGGDQRQSVRFSQPTYTATPRRNEAILQDFPTEVDVAYATARNCGLQRKDNLQALNSTIRNEIGICGNVNQLNVSYPWRNGFVGHTNARQEFEYLGAQHRHIVSPLVAIAALISGCQSQSTFY